MRLKTVGFACVCLAALWPAVSMAAGRSALADAVRAGDKNAVRALIKARADVNAPEEDGTTALHWAVRAGDLDTVNVLLRARADVMAANRYGIRPLSLAAVNGNPAVIEALLKAGADPNTANAEGETALMTTARGGSLEAVKMLLAHGATVNAKEKWLQETALMWAAAENHAEVVKTLLEVGADINAKSWVTDTPTLTFPKSGGPNQPFPKGGWTALMYAARQGSLEAARALADKGADLNAQDPQGATAMEVAIINLHYDTAALLLDKGASPNVTNETGMAPLYAVAYMNTLQWIQGRPAPALTDDTDAAALALKLLAKGADPNVRLKAAVLKRHHDFQSDRTLAEGSTPLMRAAKLGDAKLAKILLEHGADPKLVQKDETNALMIAAGVGLGAVRGEDPHLLHPSEDGAVDVIKMLLDRGVDINAANNLGLTAVHGAVQRSQGIGNGTGEKIITLLAERGAKLDAKNKKGQTPLDLARAGEGQILNRTVDSGPTAKLLERLLADVPAGAQPEAKGPASQPGDVNRR